MVNSVVLEDEQDIATLAAINLRSAAHHVDFAVDDEVGLSRNAEIEPGVVALDVMLPSMDGHTICETIRANRDSERPTDIILLSVRSEGADRQRGVEAGCDASIINPVHLAELLNPMEELREKRGGR